MAERAIVFETIISDTNQTRHFIRYVNVNWKRGLTSKDTQSPVKQRGDRLKARRRQNPFFRVPHHTRRIRFNMRYAKHEIYCWTKESKDMGEKKKESHIRLDSRFSGFGLLCLRRDILCVLPSPNQRRHAWHRCRYTREDKDRLFQIVVTSSTYNKWHSTRNEIGVRRNRLFVRQ